ncbi:unnamed protein product [Protopolystoma xenopodis]|uniref:Uncharacterized protein n=1 Tax=Protopolystoma xenopodis TaxID=117903 RepID=A0A3S5ANH4_9PLAT|nr:unnamed protein product [Protopolystoma xenopodis]
MKATAVLGQREKSPTGCKQSLRNDSSRRQRVLKVFSVYGVFWAVGGRYAGRIHARHKRAFFASSGAPFGSFQLELRVLSASFYKTVSLFVSFKRSVKAELYASHPQKALLVCKSVTFRPMTRVPSSRRRCEVEAAVEAGEERPFEMQQRADLECSLKLTTHRQYVELVGSETVR